MDPTWLVLIALVLGLAIGAGFVWVFHLAERRGASAAHVVNPSVPDGVEQVLDALESAGIVIDPSNNVLKASPGALAMGLVWNGVLVHSELVDLAGGVRRTGESVTEDISVARGPLGGEALLQLHVRIARLGTRFIMILAEDRTEAVRLDEVRRDFVANISHELKTPIASVSLLAEALDQAADEPPLVRRFAHRLSSESSRLARITSEIIELSRLQAHDALRPDELIEVDDIVAAAVDQNRIVAEARGIEIAVKAKSKAQVYGDPALLLVAVNNLVSNAVSYSNDNSRVGIGVTCDEGIVEIAVIDQGIGIVEDDLERIFERFYRVDQARSRNTGGSGLGLSIVKHTVQNHGGEVRAWSHLGRGSTFVIRLPEAPLDPAIDLSTATPQADSPAVLPTLTTTPGDTL